MMDTEMEQEGGTLARVALERILGLIRAGELKAGSIVNEVELARQFDMSRGPVREAIRNLEGRKLIVREAYRRARIVPLDTRRIKGVFQLREALEGMACRLATEVMSNADMAAFLQMIEDAENSSRPDPFFTSDFNLRFHREIAIHSGNVRIREILFTEVYELVRLYRWTVRAVPGRSGAAHVEHWQIARAMKARDADLAESLMRAHIRHAMQMPSEAG